jgi:hypothetical protein
VFPDTVRRWLYRRRHASRLAKVLKAAQARLAVAGVGPRWLVMVQVTGRRSSKTISFPAVIADHDNGRYLVSMLGEDSKLGPQRASVRRPCRAAPRSPGTGRAAGS